MQQFFLNMTHFHVSFKIVDMVKLYNTYLNSYWAQNIIIIITIIIIIILKKKKKSHVVLRGNPKNLSVLSKH